MTIIVVRPLLRRAQARRIVRWSRALLFMAGTAALAYVGITLLYARIYQASAKRSLDDQVQMVQEPGETWVKSTFEDGDVVGRIDIPRLGISVAVLQGTGSRVLRMGAGHIKGTPLPGQPGNSGIAAHRDTFFRDLKDIRRNDEIQLQTATGLTRYAVDWMKVVEPDDTTVLKPSTAGYTLTLVTCYPFQFLGPAPQRFVVHARKN